MVNDKVSITLRIDSKLHSKIKFIANQEQRSWNSQVEYAIAKFIKDYEKENGSISLNDFEE